MAITSSTVAGAPSIVFQSYKLLEQVLLHLPLRDLLLAQGINKACWDVVHRSGEIKKALFLASADHVSHQRKDSRRIFNPFIKMHNREFLDHPSHAERKRLLKREDAVFISEEDPVSSLQASHFFACQRGAMLGYSQQARHGMLVIHPPVGSVTLIDDDASAGIDQVDTVFNARGVTYGYVLAAAKTVWKKSGKKTPRMYYLNQANTWLQFAGSIDSITGFEILGMLGMDVQDLVDRGLVVARKGVKTKVRAKCGYYIENPMD